MLLPRPGDIYHSKITNSEFVVESIITANDEYIVFHNVDAPMVRQQMTAKAFEDEFEFVRSQ